MAGDEVRGFVLQPTYRIESGRPVVHLWGVLEEGGTFLIRDHRLIPAEDHAADEDAHRKREAVVDALTDV